jgi:MFS family permease
MMRRSELHVAQRVARAKGQLREGVRYAWRTPNLRDPLMLVFVVGLLAYNFTVILPLLAQDTFHGGAGTFALLTSLMAGGAVVGGLIVANRGKPNIHRLTGVGIAFSVMIGVVALARRWWWRVWPWCSWGGLSIAFIATANSTIQLRVEPTMRGRVMALYAMGFLGTTPIGAPLVGWISQTSSPRVALLVGATATLVASTVTRLRHRNEHRRVEALATARVVDEAEPGTELGVA